MNVLCDKPAKNGSTRLHRKMLAEVPGIPLIQPIYFRANQRSHYMKKSQGQTFEFTSTEELIRAHTFQEEERA